MRRSNHFLVQWTAIIAILLSVVSNASALTLVKARLSANEVAAVLQRALKGTKIVLNTYGPLKNGSHYRDHQSYVIIGKGIGGNGKKRYLSLPEISRTLWRGHYGYYLNDIRSRSPRVRAGNKGFVATIPFETRGSEMVGRCTAHKLSLKFWDTKNGKVRPCKGLAGQQLMPDIHWTKPAIEIAFTPRRYGDSMTFYIDRITVRGEVDAGKVCDWKFVGKSVCEKISKYKKQVRKKVGALLMAQLSTPKVRRKVALATQGKIDRKTGTSLLKIKKVSMNRGVIRVALGL